MVIEYDTPDPDELPFEGDWNAPEYSNPEIDLRKYVERAEDAKVSENFVGIFTSAQMAEIRGPVKLVVSTRNPKASPIVHATDIVTTPFGEVVRFTIPTSDLDQQIRPVEEYTPLKTSAIAGVPSGVAGAAGGQYFLENPWVGAITAVIGAGGGFGYEYSKFSEYGVERVK